MQRPLEKLIYATQCISLFDNYSLLVRIYAMKFEVGFVTHNEPHAEISLMGKLEG